MNWVSDTGLAARFPHQRLPRLIMPAPSMAPIGFVPQFEIFEFGGKSNSLLSGFR
jgi:hypothetical protein